MEISCILLNFFANYIQYPIETEDRVHVMDQVIELLRYLIESHSVYSGIIEAHLCEKNAQWMPFQVVILINILKIISLSGPQQAQSCKRLFNA